MKYIFFTNHGDQIMMMVITMSIRGQDNQASEEKKICSSTGQSEYHVNS